MAGLGQREWDREGGLEIDCVLRICVRRLKRTRDYRISVWGWHHTTIPCPVLFLTLGQGEVGQGTVRHR